MENQVAFPKKNRGWTLSHQKQKLFTKPYIRVSYLRGCRHLGLDNWASLVAQPVKRLPAMWETWVLSLDQEDPLEEEMATHSSALAWKIPWMEEPGRLQVAKSWTRLSNFTGSLEFFFNWVIVALQYHVSFCCTMK